MSNYWLNYLDLLKTPKRVKEIITDLECEIKGYTISWNNKTYNITGEMIILSGQSPSRLVDMIVENAVGLCAAGIFPSSLLIGIVPFYNNKTKNYLYITIDTAIEQKHYNFTTPITLKEIRESIQSDLPKLVA